MPICEVGRYQNLDGAATTGKNGIKIFYRTYGKGPTKVLMIIGLAGTHDSWGPQIKGLTGTTLPNDEELPESAAVDGGAAAEGVEVCAFDNRGMGRSSVPTKKSEYTTKIMAKDALALMDHLGWKKAHVFGHSMGAMIACKLAAMAPERILSLALLNVTGGGYECLPKFDRKTMSIALRFLRAKTPEQRAAVDLDTHYSQEYLEEFVGLTTRRAILYQQYVKGISSTGMQSKYGFDGQINACWTHKMSRKELESIRMAGFPISVIHGRHDVIAQLCRARRLAEKLYPSARMVEEGEPWRSGKSCCRVTCGHGFESWERPLANLIGRGRLAPNTPLWWDPSPDPRLAGTLRAPGCPFARMVELNGGHLVSHERTEEVNKALLELIKASENTTSTYQWTNLSTKSRGYKASRVLVWRATSSSFVVESVDKLHVFFLYLLGLFVLAFQHLKRGVMRLKPARVGPALT